MTKRFLYVFAILLLIAAPCFGATYYISQSTGDDGNAGSSAAPWKELDQIEDESFASGDKILLLCGDTWSRSGGDWGSGETDIYVENQTNPTIGAYYLDGATPREIDGSTYTCSLTTSSPRACPIIEGDKSTFTYATDYNVYNAVFRILNGATGLTIHDLRLQNYYYGIRSGTSATSTGVTIERVRTYNMGQAGISPQSPDADSWVIQDNQVILSNVVNADNSTATWGCALQVNYADSITIRRNEVGQGYGEGICLHSGADTATIYDNLIWDIWSVSLYVSTSHAANLYDNYIINTDDTEFSTTTNSGARTRSGIGFGSESDTSGFIDSSGCTFRGNIVIGKTYGFSNTDGQNDADTWEDGTPGTTNLVIHNTFIDNLYNYRPESGADKEIEIEFQNNLSVLNDTTNCDHSSVATPGTEFVWSGNGWDNSEAADTDYCSSGNCSTGGDISGDPVLVNASPCSGAGWYECADYNTPSWGDAALQVTSDFLSNAADLGTGSSYLLLNPNSEWPDSVNTLDPDTYGWNFGAYSSSGTGPPAATQVQFQGIQVQGFKNN